MESECKDTLCECPICEKRYSALDIERHVDSCLTASENQCAIQEGSPSNVKKRVSFETASPFNVKKRVSFETASPSNVKKRVSFETASPFNVKKYKPVDIAGWCGMSTMSGVSTTKDKIQQDDSNKPVVQTKAKNNQTKAPLADQLRPTELSDYVGQQHVLKHDSIFRKLIESRKIPSMIFWGPPGCGKTSLANVIAVHSRRFQDSRFVTLSATTAGVADVKEVIKTAKNDWMLFKRNTILFIDEIHRFNKLQQDTFLPVVEDGTIILIGATTENPSFSLNSALLSRCKVLVLEKLTVENIRCILDRAVKHLKNVHAKNSDTESEPNINGGDSAITIEDEALSVLAHLSDGDARMAITCLQMAVEAQMSKIEPGKSSAVIKVELIKESLQRTHLLYDKKGDEHYNCISALHKSMRGNDGDASLYWLGRMLEGGEDPLYVARRLIRFASEDIGLADPLALNQAVATYQACHFIGMPECNVNLAQCVVYLAEAPKSTRIYNAYNRVRQCIKSHEGPLPGVPLHLRNAPTKLMKDLGYGRDYKYNPAYNEPVEQDYLPECLKGVKFLED